MPAPPFEPYSSLQPYEGLFAAGLPILMYHKLGPRPFRVRLKGLYVSAPLFRRQLAELHAAGFETMPPPVSGASLAPGPKRIVLTFDDGFQNVLRYGVPALAMHGFRSIQYLVAGRLGGRNDWDLPQGEAPARLMDAAQVRDWLAAGQWIGSHTVTHAWLTRIPPRDAKEEILASKKRLEDEFGVVVEHFCYPYGDWNPEVRDLVVAAGYRTACTTEAGLNTIGGNLYELKRFTARYPTRNLKAIWRRWRGRRR